MKQKRTAAALCLTVFAVVLAVVFFTVPALAARPDKAVVDLLKSCQLILDYKEDVGGKEPVIGAEFTAYKIAALDPAGGYRMLLDGMEPVSDDTDPEELLSAVRNAFDKNDSRFTHYQAVTDRQGRAVMDQMEQGLYLVEESAVAEGHFSGKPFLCALPQTENNTWVYTVTAEPKPVPAGSLTVSKTVKSDKKEKKEEFHFTIVFAQYDKPVHYTKSDHTEGTLQSGGTLMLRHHESAVFDMLPVGLSYKVTEKEADQGGFRTTSVNASGTIRREGSRAAFTNTQSPPETGDRHFLLFAAILSSLSLLAAVFLWQIFRSKKEVS